MKNYFEKVKNWLNLDVTDEILIALIFEMTRKKDKEFVIELQKIQKKYNVVFNTIMRNKIRKKYYFGNDFLDQEGIEQYNIEVFTYNNTELEEVFEDFYGRLNTYDPNKIIKSLTTNIKDLKRGSKVDRHAQSWLDFYKKKNDHNNYALMIYKIDQEEFKKNDYSLNFVNDFIYDTYDKLINYRHLAIVFENDLIDNNGIDITWKIIYKAGIYAENFVQYKDKFIPFKKENQINILSKFLESRQITNSSNMAKKFYEAMSYGYKFEDLYISENEKTKILILKKIELDNSNIPCPSCLTTIQRGNSYPEVFLRSWECQNPSCPDRSKSGRGKRFDEFGTYRYFQLMKNDNMNRIDDDMYYTWRRDIFKDGSDWKKYLIKNYSYKGETVLTKNLIIDNSYDRNSIHETVVNENTISDKAKTFENLPIYKLFSNIFANKPINHNRSIRLQNRVEVINDDSRMFLNRLIPGQIGAAITSPPYYNAREYSQWENLILYFVDMLLNADAVYNSLADNSHYLYNIGDIVAEDNIYVVSLMSKKRIQLGFLSSMLFEIAGFSLIGNIIWDKGQVQSKRNSTVNLFSGYVKCINSYEHVLVFKKGLASENPSKIVRINPVIKINNKGVNTYKHTAPYPIELVELIRELADKNLYVLDPYLGSGTTVKWAIKNNYKALGIELNDEYYNLSLVKIYENENKD